jgi:hypothetical protein
MENNIGTFPFGQSIHVVKQTDRAAKDCFVLGVYASAVHARWVDPEGRELAKALAVASEPQIFWNGANQEGVISQVSIPPLAGSLLPAPLNGASGKALEQYYLAPLKLMRKDVWLCDLLPFFHVRPKSAQDYCIHTTHNQLALLHGWPIANIPRLSGTFTIDSKRVAAIQQELAESQAKVLITLGDDPLRLFTCRFDEKGRTSVREFGTTTYGQPQKLKIAGHELIHIPLVHPRQAGKLGTYSSEWRNLHDAWTHHAESLV